MLFTNENTEILKEIQNAVDYDFSLSIQDYQCITSKIKHLKKLQEEINKLQQELEEHLELKEISVFQFCDKNLVKTF